jgi:DNA-binding transcriptional LysR family regulator
MDTRHLKTFLSAAASENFRQAARENGISQPAVSQQIRAIEAELGLVLFRKVGRGVELTEAGRFVVAAASQVQMRLDEMMKVTQMLRRNDLGEIAIGYSTSLMSERRLPDVLRQFAEAHPSIEITPDPMRVADAIDALMERRIDMAVVRAPLPPLPAELSATVFDRARLMLALPNGHILARGRPIEWQELNGSVLLTMRDPPGVGLREITERLLEQHRIVPAKLRYVGDMTALLGLIASGAGIAILPEEIARSHRSVTAMHLGVSPSFVEAFIVFRHPIVTAAVRHLIERLEHARFRDDS